MDTGYTSIALLLLVALPFFVAQTLGSSAQIWISIQGTKLLIPKTIRLWSSSRWLILSSPIVVNFGSELAVVSMLPTLF